MIKSTCTALIEISLEVQWDSIHTEQLAIEGELTALVHDRLLHNASLFCTIRPHDFEITDIEFNMLDIEPLKGT